MFPVACFALKALKALKDIRLQFSHESRFSSLTVSFEGIKFSWNWGNHKIPRHVFNALGKQAKAEDKECQKRFVLWWRIVSFWFRCVWIYVRTFLPFTAEPRMEKMSSIPAEGGTREDLWFKLNHIIQIIPAPFSEKIQLEKVWRVIPACQNGDTVCLKQCLN